VENCKKYSEKILRTEVKNLHFYLEDESAPHQECGERENLEGCLVIYGSCLSCWFEQGVMLWRQWGKRKGYRLQ
jgi:hypothetical protein